MAGPPHTGDVRGTSLKWLTKFAEHFHLCSPHCFSFAHMLPPSVDIHQWGSPPNSLFLSPPRWDLREHWMESFSSHMTLSPRCVFRCCWATHSSHRAPLFLQHGDTKATFEACTAKRRQWNTRHNKWSCCACVCVCVCDEWPDRETRHWPLVMEP